MKDWRQERMTEDEMYVGCITDSSGHEFDKLQEMVRDEEACCCSSWDFKGSNMTEQLNNSLLYVVILILDLPAQHGLRLSVGDRRQAVLCLTMLSRIGIYFINSLIVIQVLEEWSRKKPIFNMTYKTLSSDL